MQATLQIQGEQTTTEETLIHLKLTAAQTAVLSVVIPSMHKALPAQQKSISVRLVRNMDTFTSLCFSNQKPHTKHSAYQITAEEIENNSEFEVEEDADSTSDDSFVLYQMKAVINQAKGRVPKNIHLIANLPYQIKQHQAHHKYLRVRLDTCADVNIMPKSMYQMMFNDPEVKHLAENDISLGVYTDHQVNIFGKCQFYVLHPYNKKPQPVTFYVVSNEGSVLLSCTTLLALNLIQARPHLDYLPPKAKPITSAADHPTLTRHTAHQAKATVKPKEPQFKPMIIVTNKSDIKEHYQDVFEGVRCFPRKSYHNQVDLKVPPKQTPVRPVAVHLKDAFKQELGQNVASWLHQTCACSNTMHK